jgi:Zn-finger protein
MGTKAIKSMNGEKILKCVNCGLVDEESKFKHTVQRTTWHNCPKCHSGAVIEYEEGCKDS